MIKLYYCINTTLKNVQICFISHRPASFDMADCQLGITTDKKLGTSRVFSLDCTTIKRDIASEKNKIFMGNVDDKEMMMQIE